MVGSLPVRVRGALTRINRGGSSERTVTQRFPGEVLAGVPLRSVYTGPTERYRAMPAIAMPEAVGGDTVIHQTGRRNPQESLT